MLLDKIAHAMNRQGRRRLGAALLCTLLLTACTDDDPGEQEPLPVVTAEEFEQRLTAHLSRFVTEVLDTDAHASEPSTSRVKGCADPPDSGPTWGVVPRAELTVAAGRQAKKYVDDIMFWMLDNEFLDVENRATSTPRDAYEVTGAHKDGTQVRVEWPFDSPKFGIALTGPCTWPPDRPDGPPSGQLPSLPPPSGPGPVVNDVDACRSPKLNIYDDEARPFTGRGPHPMVLAHYSDEKAVEYSNFYLPDGWEPDDILYSHDPGRKNVQLLACVRMDAGRDSGRNATCDYSSSPLWGGTPHTFDVLESIYHVVVREALTGKKVAEFTVPGTQGDEESCPYETGYKRQVARGIDEDALRSKLRPLFTSPR